MTDGVERQVVFGARFVPTRLPAHTQVVSPGFSLPLEPAGDLESVVATALAAPLDRPPLRDQVARGSRVTIAFDDPTVPCYAPVWAVALPAIVDELERGGITPADISFVCAN